MLDALSDVTGYSPGGVPVGRIVLSLLVIAAAFLARRLIRSALRRKGSGEGFLSTLTRDIEKPLGLLLLMVGILVAIRIHTLSPGASDWVRRIFIFVITVDVLWLLMRTIDAVGEQMVMVAAGTNSRMDDQLIPILRKLAKFILVAVGVIFYMQSNGYPVGGVLAGMGIGGLALALAAQDSISGIFASIVIFLDKPFMVDDFVEVNGVSGTVEEIGIRSTRIRTLEKTLVTIPNKEIMDSNIDNFSKRPMRRVVSTIGVTYDTTPDGMLGLLAGLREMLSNHPMVSDEGKYVNFTGFGGSSLDVDLKYYIRTADYEKWLTLREELNLEIMRVVQGLGLEFAFPSTTVYMAK